MHGGSSKCFAESRSESLIGATCKVTWLRALTGTRLAPPPMTQKMDEHAYGELATVNWRMQPSILKLPTLYDKEPY
ncbi:hypothetical protein GMST_14190 [Geomonas silvestris]|uniref:Uncharacterized protein n=1 Tax=Geomonas silvestris TaxID=2740184 RepID=A0A6V8MGQ7_9BACT|nr:hypothetical protein GMST_14190 [Geomonas silvestris]